MNKCTILILVGILAFTFAESINEGSTAVGEREYTREELEAFARDLEQTPAEDRHLKLKKLIKLGILAKILAIPALASSVFAIAVVCILSALKSKLPPVSLVPLPPPVTPYYEEPAYEPSYKAPAYSPPPPAYQPQPSYNPAPAYQPPAYQPPAYQAPAYQPPAYQPPQHNYKEETYSSASSYGQSNQASSYNQQSYEKPYSPPAYEKPYSPPAYEKPYSPPAYDMPYPPPASYGPAY